MARNSGFVVQQALPGVARARASGLMHAGFTARDQKRVRLNDGQWATEFINCSYLGLDVHPAVVAGAKRVLDDFGVHFCCARSRLTIGPNEALEAELSSLFRGRAITFPTVTSAHMSVLPLIASGLLLPPGLSKRTRMVFDKRAHASMQYLRPILAEEAAHVGVIPHNDLHALEAEAKAAKDAGQTLVYLADGVYSMGGVCPLPEVLALAERYGFVLYLDDAHGTSIFGAHGEGFARGAIRGELPENVILAFSLAKGFGCNGGGLVLPTSWQEELVRQFGTTYAFSAPLDFSIVGAALEAVKLHRDGTVEQLQKALRARVAQFDAVIGAETRDFSPIRRIAVGDEQAAIALGEHLLARGFLVSVAFFPVVPRAEAQLRVCLSVHHTAADVQGLAEALASARSDSAKIA